MWRQRWGMLKKLSPVADCVHLCLHKESDASSFRLSFVGGGSSDDKLRSHDMQLIALEEFFGTVSDFELDLEKRVLSIICRRRVVTLAFYNRETLDCWSVFVNKFLGEGSHYSVKLAKAPTQLRLHYGPSHLFIRNSEICLTTCGDFGSPPVFLASWRITHLCRFGVQCGFFCFVAGEHTDLPGVFALKTSSAVQINKLLNTVVKQSLKGNTSLNYSTGHGETCCMRSSVVGYQSANRIVDMSLHFSCSSSSCDREDNCTTERELESSIETGAYASADSSCFLDNHEDYLLSYVQHADEHSRPLTSLDADGNGGRPELNRRRHSFSDIYRKLYSVVDGLMSQSWLSKSLSKFSRGTSQTEKCSESGVTEDCSDFIDGAHGSELNISMDRKRCNESLENSVPWSRLESNQSANVGCDFLSSSEPQQDCGVNHLDKPPSVPPRTSAQERLNQSQSKILIRKQSPVKQRVGGRQCRSGQGPAEQAWRHTVLLYCPDDKCSNGRVARVRHSELTMEGKSRRAQEQDARFPRSQSVGNQLHSYSLSLAPDLPQEDSLCKSCSLTKNDNHKVHLTGSIVEPDRTLVIQPGHVKPVFTERPDPQSLHSSGSDKQSMSSRSRNDSTSSLDQLGVPPSVPTTYQNATDSTAVSSRAFELPQKCFKNERFLTDGTLGVNTPLMNPNTSHYIDTTVSVKTSLLNQNTSQYIDTTVGVHTPLLNPNKSYLSDRRRASKKPNLTVNTDEPRASTSGKLSSGISSHSSALPRFLSDLKPHFVQSQPATPAVVGSHNPRSHSKSELHRTTSQASTSLRPRYGQEYLRIHRRRLASTSVVDWSPALSTPRSPGSQSLATLCVFDFDSLTCSQGSGRYGNNAQADGIDLDTVLLPQQPLSLSVLNYTDLDLSDSSCKSRSDQHTSTIYADIDFEATAAVSRAGREHDLDRRDNKLSALSRTGTQRNARVSPSGLQV